MTLGRFDPPLDLSKRGRSGLKVVNCTKLFEPMTLFPKISFDKVETVSINDRPRKVDISNLGKVFTPDSTGEFRTFLESLPDVLKARDLKEFAAELAHRRNDGKSVALMFGGHVIKTGLAPLVNDLMQAGLITSLSMNSAAAIHDAESALFGTTSEDVEQNILDGTFGMSRETGEFINGTLAKYFEEAEVGYGEALGLEIIERNAPYAENSVLAGAVRMQIPVSVHAAIGTDIVHQQPTMRGDVTGEMSFRDFRLLATICGGLQDGAAINVGSSVIMPEVFLKGITIARNLKLGGRNMITANFDMLQQYRTQMNILERPTRPNSKFYNFTGHHEIMVPLFAATYKYFALEYSSIARRQQG
jgi:deoxyhypusine synthase